MTKVVYNNCFGGFGLSDQAEARYWELKGHPKPDGWWIHDLDRTDPCLVQVVEELGALANDNYSDLAIAELEPGTLYKIDEYDGMESVVTQSDYTWSVA